MNSALVDVDLYKSVLYSASVCIHIIYLCSKCRDELPAQARHYT